MEFLIFNGAMRKKLRRLREELRAERDERRAAEKEAADNITAMMHWADAYDVLIEDANKYAGALHRISERSCEDGGCCFEDGEPPEVACSQCIATWALMTDDERAKHEQDARANK